jgi:hypothetical protein
MAHTSLTTATPHLATLEVYMVSTSPVIKVPVLSLPSQWGLPHQLLGIKLRKTIVFKVLGSHYIKYALKLFRFIPVSTHDHEIVVILRFPNLPTNPTFQNL